MSVLVCPVCQGSVREVSNNGVLIDSCTQCRGVWLDRGELEKLANVVGGSTERSFLGHAPRSQVDRRSRSDDDDDDDDDRRRGDRYSQQNQPPQQRRKSFLDFFD